MISVLAAAAVLCALDCFLAVGGASLLGLARRRGARLLDGQAPSLREALRSDGAALFYKLGGPAVFLLLYNATPSATVSLASFRFALFETEPCVLTGLTLLTEAAALAGCLVYARLANRRRVQMLIALLTVVKVAASFLDLPLFGAERPGDRVGAVDATTYALLTAPLGGFLTQLAFVPLEVLATESAPAKDKVFAYAVYLSFLDLGDSIANWCTAPIVDGLGIAFPDFDNLAELLYIAAAAQVAVLALMPVLVRDLAGRDGPREARAAGGKAAPADPERDTATLLLSA